MSLIKNQIMLSKVKLQLDVPDELPFVRGNMGNLQQVFIRITSYNVCYTKLLR